MTHDSYTRQLPPGLPTSRRIGARSNKADLVGFVVIENKRIKRRVERIPAAIEDASVTGLGFVADLPRDVIRGEELTFEFNGVSSAVRVRRVTRRPAGQGNLYGVEFVEAVSAVSDELHRLTLGPDGKPKDRPIAW